MDNTKMIICTFLRYCHFNINSGYSINYHQIRQQWAVFIPHFSFFNQMQMCFLYRYHCYGSIRYIPYACHFNLDRSFIFWYIHSKYSLWLIAILYEYYVGKHHLIDYHTVWVLYISAIILFYKYKHVSTFFRSLWTKLSSSISILKLANTIEHTLLVSYEHITILCEINS